MPPALSGSTRRIAARPPNSIWEVFSVPRGRFGSTMSKIRDPQRGDLLLIGLEAFIPARSPVSSGHRVVDVGYARLDAGGWFLAGYPGGRCELRQITGPAATGQALGATRGIRASPFPNDGGMI